MTVLVDTSVLIDQLRGVPLSPSDLVTAATALLLGAQLLTRNVRHFAMFPGLRAPY